jgi:NadR type nicotinamide-nucleotide adenylyltransferase
MGTNALIFGKFAPFHNGHLSLVRAALASCDRVWVLVNDHPELTPHGTAIRCGWIRDTFPGASLEVIGASAPPESGRTEQAMRENFQHMVRHLPPGLRIARVFCNEWYGEHIARDFGATWERVDPDRKEHPVSATEIRAAPWAHWGELPEVVRPAFVQLVCVVGAESTGKTTLTEQLAERFGTTWVAEYAREYLEAHDNVCRPESMVIIAREQRRREEEARTRADRFLFCDTDALTTSLWSEHYFGDVDPAVTALAADPRYALHLLLASDLPWVDDGMRDSPGKGKWFFDRFRQELSGRELRHRVVEGAGPTRLASACGHLDALFAL